MIRDALVKSIISLPDDWQKRFVESLKDLTDEHNPEMYLFDGSPFLASSQAADAITDEDTAF